MAKVEKSSQENRTAKLNSRLKKENADQFLKIDTNGNALENFFKKFSAQFSHPSHTGVYAVSASAVDKVAAFFDKLIRIDQ